MKDENIGYSDDGYRFQNTISDCESCLLPNVACTERDNFIGLEFATSACECQSMCAALPGCNSFNYYYDQRTDVPTTTTTTATTAAPSPASTYQPEYGTDEPGYGDDAYGGKGEMEFY